ncbi:metallophosphoesterase [Nocardia sp. AG03]|uniref:metallophosphoesterase n=1 Tax=Nocardia sp. AG03 TaxID=3025312 RepID=UPI002418898A|nr:metallophosphoesterase [Nocardia sp. AG03]
MLRLVIAAAVLGLIHLLLHRRLVRATGLRGRWAVAADGVLVAGWVLAIAGILVGAEISPHPWRPLGFLGLTWLAVVFYLVLGLAVLGVVLLILRLVARFRGEPGADGRRRFLRVATAVMVVAAVGTTAYGVVEAAAPRVVRQTVALPRLPEEFRGVRVAVVSDIHVGPARGAEFTRRVVEMVERERPDLIAVVGDLADGTVGRVGDDLLPLSELRAPLGVFAVSGNHEQISDDVGDWMQYWKSLGLTVVNNSRVEVRRGAAVIDVAGVYDYSNRAPYEPDLDAALAGHAPDRFVLLLAHQPNHIATAAAAGVDLQVSGHTHGGQMWPLRSIVEWVHDTEVTGLDTVEDTTLFTTYGAGAWGPPVRVGAPPEVAILELVPAPKSS